MDFVDIVLHLHNQHNYNIHHYHKYYHYHMAEVVVVLDNLLDNSHLFQNHYTYHFHNNNLANSLLHFLQLHKCHCHTNLDNLVDNCKNFLNSYRHYLDTMVLDNLLDNDKVIIYYTLLEQHKSHCHIMTHTLNLLHQKELNNTLVINTHY